MSNFALDVNTPQGDIISSLNYVLSNLGTFDANIVANIANVAITSANVVTANTVTGQLSSRNSGTLSYIYNYVNVKYANNATGSSGFSSNSTNANYYGVNNTQEGTISNNPTDYVWSRVTGGFGTTKGLYFTTVGGGQIFFSANATAPSVRYSPVIDNTAILLQNLANSLVTTTTINPGAVTNVGIATQTIQTDNIGLGVITADLLSANLVIAKDIRADVGVIGDPNSPGYWMQANTGSARFAGTMSIGNNLTVGNNAVVGNSLSIGSNAFIGQGLSVGTNAIIGSGLSVGDNAVIGNSLGVGNNAVIANNLTVGNNAVIGGNLLVSGLITAGSLNTNTVNTTTITANAVTLSNAISDTAGASATNPTVSFAGNSSPYAYYSTGLTIPKGLNVDINTANVSIVINGVVDVFAFVRANVNYVTQMYAQLFRYGPGNAVVGLSSSFATTPAAQLFAANATVQATETLLPYRLVSAGTLDNFTSNGEPQTITYKWLIGTYTGATSFPANVTVPNISYTTATISATNFKR